MQYYSQYRKELNIIIFGLFCGFLIFLNVFFHAITNDDTSLSMYDILFFLIYSLLIVSFYDSLLSWLLPEVHSKGILRPGSMMLNALKRRTYILRDDIIHISDAFILNYDSAHQVMILEMDGFFIYTRQMERYYIANPWKFAGVDLRPYLKQMMGSRWDTTYLGLRSNTYFLSWEVDFLMRPLGLSEIIRHYPINMSEYRATCSKFISLYSSWSVFRTGIPDILRPYEHQIIMAVMERSGLHINQLQSIPIIQETQGTLKAKKIGGYPFKSNGQNFCPNTYY